MPIVHLRFNDAATQQPTPVRIHVSGPRGEASAPLGSHVVFPTNRAEEVGCGLLLGKDRWFVVNGGCEIHLPDGVPLRLRASKGPYYRDVDETFTLATGQLTKRFEIARWHDPLQSGWHGLDFRSHFLSPHRAALEADAEDLQVANILACDFPTAMLDGQTYHTTPQLEAFSGPEAFSYLGTASCVAVGTLNRHVVLGKLALLGTHRVVYPLSFGPPDDSDDGNLLDWCDQAQRKHGQVVWVNPFETVSGVSCGQALIALLLGKIHLIECDGEPRKQSILPLYYRLLNAGYRIRLVGSSGKENNRTPLGSMRTYVHLATKPENQAKLLPYLQALSNGPGFVTNGPWLEFLRHDGGFIAEAKSTVPFTTLELLGNGVALHSTKPEYLDGLWRARVDYEPSQPHLWYAARCVGPAAALKPTQPLFAHSQPWFDPRIQPYRRSRADLAYFIQAVESTISWLETVGQFTKPKYKEQAISQAQEALALLTSDLS